MANTLKNCSECGRVFVDTGIGVCRDCYEKQQDQMQEISSYVRDNPHSTVKQICEALNVKEKLVMRMIREGRFVTDGVQLEYPCESCGAPITSGRFCDKCNGELAKQMQQTQKKMVAKAPAPAAKKGSGMYSRDMGKKLS
ncbi:flagellar protein [Schwartzia sp. (in: firmicutes)]